MSTKRLTYLMAILDDESSCYWRLICGNEREKKAAKTFHHVSCNLLERKDKEASNIHATKTIKMSHPIQHLFDFLLVRFNLKS